MRAHRFHYPVLMLAAATLAGGCAQQSPEDEFRDAVPAAEALRVNVPGEDGSSASASGDVGGSRAALIGERAKYYQFTRDTSRTVNGVVWMTMHIVETIVSHPPTAIDASHAVWGPWTEALNPLTYAFAVEKAGEGHYRFALIGKPRGAGDDAFVPLLAGESEVDPSRGANRGSIGLDLDAAHALDAHEHPGQGRIAATYDIGGDPRQVEAAFEGFVDADSGRPITARYRYREAREGSGSFEFGARVDVADDGSAQEDLVVMSRWDKTGQGRGDVIVAHGDLGDAAIQASECWDRGFGRTYYTDSANSEPTEGDATSCAFAVPLWSSMPTEM